MLASITPLGERGRRQTYGVTVAALIAGGAIGGAGFGALAGAAGSLALGGAWLGSRARLAVLAAALVAAAIVDLRPGPAPGPRRQVDERWLTAFRGWVYGLGFGAQLGVGVSTVVSSACTYVAVLAAFLLAAPWRGALVLACFGALRGVSVLPAAGVRTPDALFALHSRVEAWRAPARTAAIALTGALALAAVLGAAA
jgi:hypothetical protein